jgi:hypothetical protein
MEAMEEATQAGATAVAGCKLCGAAPTAKVAFTQQTGMLFRRKWRTIDGELCRSCGLAIGRSFLNKTLMTGWWGTISFVTNWFYAARNVIGLTRCHRLAEPMHPRSDEAPVKTLHPGKPVMQRAGAWVFIGLMAVAGIAIRNESHANAAKAASHERGVAATCIALRSGQSADSVAAELLAAAGSTKVSQGDMAAYIRKVAQSRCPDAL